MISLARKCTTNENADFYTDESNEPVTETHIPEVLSPRARMFKVIDGRRATAIRDHDSRMQSVPIFVLHDRFNASSAVDAEDDLQRYLDNYAAIEELRTRRKPRPLGLLWASLTCFGIAALFLVALMGQLS